MTLVNCSAQRMLTHVEEFGHVMPNSGSVHLRNPSRQITMHHVQWTLWHVCRPDIDAVHLKQEIVEFVPSCGSRTTFVWPFISHRLGQQHIICHIWAACEALILCWVMCRNVSFITLPETSWYPDWQTVIASLCLCRSRREEAAQHYPEEHGDRTGRRDEKQNDQAGQPRIRWRQHEQLQLRGKVSNKTRANRTLLTNITV